MKVTVYLKGNLQWYDEDNRSEVIIDEDELTPAKVIEKLGIPQNQIQFVLVNDEKSADLEKQLNEKDVVKFIPVIEGG